MATGERRFEVWGDYLGLAAVVAALRRMEAAVTPGASPVQPVPSPVQLRQPAPSGGCPFCRHNGEAKQVYTGHRLRDASGRVLCPVLRSYVCPQCGATEDRAHTRRFCPLTRRGYTSVYNRTSHPRRCRGPEWGRRWTLMGSWKRGSCTGYLMVVPDP
uniref:Uncharacterized protein n=1 Tax=Melopsittacus undulatus TaxID=13146 RepID=A0A8V5H4Y0_MELUD